MAGTGSLPSTLWVRWLATRGCLGARWRWIVFCVWTAWAMQAGFTVRGVHRASIDLIEKVYRPNLTPPNPHVALVVWISARETALRLR